jgi:hypothetical protein
MGGKKRKEKIWIYSKLYNFSPEVQQFIQWMSLEIKTAFFSPTFLLGTVVFSSVLSWCNLIQEQSASSKYWRRLM